MPLVLRLVREASQGATRLAASLTSSLLEEAVLRRLTVRRAACPSPMKEVGEVIVRTDPFHPLPCGPDSAVRAAVGSLPRPVQLQIPTKVLQSLRGNNGPRRGYAGPRVQHRKRRASPGAERSHQHRRKRPRSSSPSSRRTTTRTFLSSQLSQRDLLKVVREKMTTYKWGDCYCGTQPGRGAGRGE